MRKTMLGLFALTAACAFAQDDMMMKVDAKTSKPYDLLAFIKKDAYKKLSAPKAYTLVAFVTGLPGNYQTAVLRGLVGTAQEADEIRMKNQAAANAMPPMGEMMPEMKSSFNNYQKGERSFEMVTMDPQARVSYLDVIKLLQKGQDQTDQGLIQTLFTFRSFTETQIPTVENERAFDAINTYIRACAMATQPYRLKYTSLAPHMYVSPVIPR